MNELFERRRKVMSDDCTPISDSDTRAQIWNEWCNDFLRKELNAEQRSYTRAQQTSIFNAYMRNRYGSKTFVFALLQTGMSWKLPAPLRRVGATEHVHTEAEEHAAKRFVQWVRDLIESIQFHKSQE